MFYHLILSMMVLLFLLVGVSQAKTMQCNTSPVFALSQALYAGRYNEAHTLVTRVKNERGDEMAQFLSQVINWKQAYDNLDKSAQHRALDSIDSQIKLLIADLADKQSTVVKLNAGNIMIHAARMNIASGRFFRASKLIKRGYRLLRGINDKEPENVDGFLALGLIYYHAGSDKPGFSWLTNWLALEGEQHQGKALMQKALLSSPDFAFEAVRSLVMETNWNKSELCAYPSLLGDDDKSSAPLSAQLQAINVQLFCGQSHEALAGIDRLNAKKGIRQQHDWLYEARLYALAQSAQIDKINQMIAALDVDKAKKRLLGQFSLAKAYDLNEQRAQAVTLYQNVLTSNIGQSYKILAKAYLDRPYKLSVQAQPVPENKLQFACDATTLFR